MWGGAATGGSSACPPPPLGGSGWPSKAGEVGSSTAMERAVGKRSGNGSDGRELGGGGSQLLLPRGDGNEELLGLGDDERRRTVTMTTRSSASATAMTSGSGWDFWDIYFFLDFHFRMKTR